MFWQVLKYSICNLGVLYALRYWLIENYFAIHDFSYPRFDPVHPPYPLHRLLRLELLGDAFRGSIVFDQPKKERVGLFFDVGEVRAELTGDFQVGIEDRTIHPEIA